MKQITTQSTTHTAALLTGATRGGVLGAPADSSTTVYAAAMCNHRGRALTIAWGYVPAFGTKVHSQRTRPT